MSEMKYHSGKIAKMMGLDTSSKEIMYQQICELEGFSCDDGDWLECYYDNDLCEKYIITNDGVYKIIENRSISEDDMGILIHQDDGTIDFIVSYYNGGCSFEEAIEDLLDKKE